MDAWAGGSSARLDALLKAKGWTTARLAKAMQLDPSTISRWRSGERIPNADALGVILEIVGGSADEILDLGPSARTVLEDARRLRDAADTLLRGVAASDAPAPQLTPQDLELARAEIRRSLREKAPAPRAQPRARRVR